jgi:D-alanyl-D-alanine carboxypeptidase
MSAPSATGERYYHFRYVGIPAATYMFKNNLALSDFLNLLKTEHAFGNNQTNALSVLTDDGVSYEMYYVAATEGDITSVPVSQNALHCSISGDNMSGFVVTVRMG